MASGTTTDTSRTDATQAALDALRARLAEPPPASEEASVPEPEPLAEAAETEAKEEPAQTAESGRPTQEPVSAPEPAADLASLPVTELIRTVFGPHGEKAISVAWCESSFRTEAQSGQYLGLFQMGSNERDRYGHGPDAITQVQSAYALFLERGWQPWTCG